MTTKENYIKRYNDVKQDIVDAMDKALERAIGNGLLDLDQMNDNYSAVFPLVVAVLQRQVKYQSYYFTRAEKQWVRKHQNDYRLWMDYVGDYRGTPGEYDYIQKQ